MPDDDRERDAQPDEREQDEPETQAGAPHFAFAEAVSATPCPMQAIRLLNGRGIKLQCLFGVEASGRLGHSRESNCTASYALER